MSQEIRISGTLNKNPKTNGFYFKSSETLAQLEAAKHNNVRRMLRKGRTWFKFGNKNPKLQSYLKQSCLQLDNINANKSIDVVAIINQSTQQICKIVSWSNNDEVIYTC
tara:strand:- start:6020 stop:6346 length:327 start_codon:yes stop_codon:yes gene_type:complete